MNLNLNKLAGEVLRVLEIEQEIQISLRTKNKKITREGNRNR
jgi:hypothetical protein